MKKCIIVFGQTLEIPAIVRARGGEVGGGVYVRGGEFILKGGGGG